MFGHAVQRSLKRAQRARRCRRHRHSPRSHPRRGARGGGERSSPSRHPARRLRRGRRRGQGARRRAARAHRRSTTSPSSAPIAPASSICSRARALPRPSCATCRPAPMRAALAPSSANPARSPRKRSPRRTASPSRSAPWSRSATRCSSVSPIISSFSAPIPATSAVLLYIESIDDLARFRDRGASRRRGEAGDRADRRPHRSRARAPPPPIPAPRRKTTRRWTRCCAECGILRVDSAAPAAARGQGLRRLPARLRQARAHPVELRRARRAVHRSRRRAKGSTSSRCPPRWPRTLRANLPRRGVGREPARSAGRCARGPLRPHARRPRSRGRAAFDAILGIHIVPFMVDAAADRGAARRDRADACRSRTCTA